MNDKKKIKCKKSCLVITGVIITVLIVLSIFVLNYMKNNDLGCSSPNLKGFCIEDGTLTGYVGLKKEITVPSNVTYIASSAFSKENYRGINLEKVIVPGTVKKIHGSAFYDSNLVELVLEEGVEEIGEYPFEDSFIDEIWLPKSIKKIGIGRIFDCDQGCPESTIVHLYKGSYADRYVGSFRHSVKRIEFIN